MKKIYSLILLIGLAVFTAATVKASEPVIKPDTTKHSTGAKIVPVAGGAWNYTTGELCASAHTAIPTVTFSKVDFENPAGTTVYWLTFEGKILATGAPHKVYFPLIKNGSWYEIDPTTVPPGWTGGGAGPASCTGDCEITFTDQWGQVITIPSGTICTNMSATWMVSCGCDGCYCGGSTDCIFKQGGYPIQVTETLYNSLKQIHD